MQVLLSDTDSEENLPVIDVRSSSRPSGFRRYVYTVYCTFTLYYVYHFHRGDQSFSETPTGLQLATSSPYRLIYCFGLHAVYDLAGRE